MILKPRKSVFQKMVSIFDLDGVLVNSSDLAYAALNHACNQANLLAPCKESFLALMGLPLETILHQLSLPIHLAPEFRQYATANANLVQIHSGAIEMLSTAKKHSKGIAILTGKDRIRAVEIIERFKISQFTDMLVTPDDAPPKPNPRAIEIILDELQGTNESSFFMGDSLIDMKTAKNANVKAIFASWDAYSKLSPDEYDMTIRSPSNINSVIDAMNKQPRQ